MQDDNLRKVQDQWELLDSAYGYAMFVDTLKGWRGAEQAALNLQAIVHLVVEETQGEVKKLLEKEQRHEAQS